MSGRARSGHDTHPHQNEHHDHGKHSHQHDDHGHTHGTGFVGWIRHLVVPHSHDSADTCRGKDDSPVSLTNVSYRRCSQQRRKWPLLRSKGHRSGLSRRWADVALGVESRSAFQHQCVAADRLRA